jgi:hypothetical protein
VQPDLPASDQLVLAVNSKDETPPVQSKWINACPADKLLDCRIIIPHGKAQAEILLYGHR